MDRLKRIKELEEAIFLLEMEDHWTSAMYQRYASMSLELVKLKEETSND